MGYLDISDRQPFTGHVTVDGLDVSLCEENDQKHEDLGDVQKVVIHWSAGPYTLAFNAYHYCLVYDAKTKQTHVLKTLKLTQKGKHAYKFNSHAVGISFMAMRSYVQSWHGPSPITDEMLNSGAKFIAEFMAWHALDPHKSHPEASYAEASMHLLDHQQVDRIIGRCQKVDIEPYRAKLWTAIIARYDALKLSKEKFAYRGLLEDK